MGSIPVNLACRKMITMEFIGIIVLILCSILISTILTVLSYMVSIKLPYLSKVSVYECGLDPFGTSRLPFSVKFFLVAILFLVFDLEIALILP